ncbi:Transducin beta-like protein 3 [Frankliniella fusca]|uniref:Transducin beta-like protein 3 n=1 Tax=Frankliniella fusca TaxID=407009 RepID=A0AAE1HF30_9NEOP|nr:Transducin beta-like protein 3 [Frankliniella fusca]
MYAIFVPFGIWIGYSLQLKIGTSVCSSIRHSMDDTSRLPSTTQGDSTAGLFAMFVVQASAGRRLTSKDITNFSLMKNRNILAGIIYVIEKTTN